MITEKSIVEIAKDKKEIALIESEVRVYPSLHKLVLGDSRKLSLIENNSVHLALTSPPYWNLKEYENGHNQLGIIDDYQEFLDELDEVWKEVFNKLQVGGRLIVVVGDVLLSRKKFGRHKVVPLHADIQVRCEKIGFDNLAPIFWHKISNATFEVSGNSKFLGKPYQPNGIIKHDIEYILMLRKPGGYRKATAEQKRLSTISEDNFNNWFTQIWNINGASTKNHPAPFPEGLTDRLIRMFSFVGDTVIDPFAGSGTTMITSAKLGRNSIGYETEKKYFELIKDRFHREFGLFSENRKLETIENG